MWRRIEPKKGIKNPLTINSMIVQLSFLTNQRPTQMAQTISKRIVPIKCIFFFKLSSFFVKAVIES